MSSQGGGGDGDHEQETVSHHRSRSGSDESAADIIIQFQIPGTQRVTIPLAELHSVIEYALHTDQDTPSSTSDTEADQLISSPANVTEGGHLTHSSASALDQPTAAPNIATLVLRPPAAPVRQEDRRPAAAVRPQPAYNLSDIYGRGSLTRGPIPPPRQVTVRGAQSALPRVPISFVDMGNGSNVTETLRQADVNSVGQTGQIYPQIPSGNPLGPPDTEATHPMQLLATSCGSSVSQQAEASVLEHQKYSPVPVGSPVPMGTAARGEVAQPPVPPERYTRPPTAANIQEPGPATQTMSGARICTPHSGLPTKGEIILIPANETVLVDDPETNAPIYNPEHHQQVSYAVQHDLVTPSEDDMTSKAEAKISTAQPSTDFSGEDDTHATICILYEGVQEEPNLNEEPETRPRIKVSPAHIICQMPHASSSPSDVLPVAQTSNAVHPESNAADSHQANHPICTSIPPQQLKTVESADSTYDFTELPVIFTQDKSTQVNNELDQQGDSPIHNPSNIQMENIDTYNNPATSSQMSPTAGDTPETTQTQSNFSLNGRSYAETQHIITQLVLDQNLHCILTPGSIQCPGGVPKDDIGMQQSEVAGNSDDTRGQDRPSGGSPLPQGLQDSLRPIENLEVAQSCAGGGTGPTAVSHQHLTTAAPRGGQKRHLDPNEVYSPTAKKQARVQLGTEFQCVPLSTTYLTQQKDSKPLSITQETCIDTVGAGASSTTKEYILTSPDGTTLACDSLKSTERVVNIQPSNKETENEITANCRQETVLAESVSVLQKTHCEHERDDQGNNDAVESQNATEEYPDEIMVILQQLNAESSDYKKAKNYVTLEIEDCRLELDETETQAAKDQNEGKQQIAEEQVNDYPPNDPQLDEKRSISEREIQTDSVNDSDSSVPQNVERIFYPIQELKRIIIEIKLECLIIRDHHFATTVEPSTSDSTTTVQTGQSKKGHGTIAKPDYSVQCAEGSNTSNVQAVGFMGNEYEVAATPGYISNKTSFEAPIIGKVSIGIDHEVVTEENRGYIPNETSYEAPLIGKLSIGVGQEAITEENGGYIPNETSCEAPIIGNVSIGIGQEGITEENGGYIPNETSWEAPIIGMLSIGIGQEGITEENGGYIPNETSWEAPIIGMLSIGIRQEGINEENGGYIPNETSLEAPIIGMLSIGIRQEGITEENDGYIPNETSCEAPITGNVSIGIGQISITEENGVVHLFIKQWVGDYDFDEESSTVEVLATTEHKEAELILDNEKNSPSEDINSRPCNISEDDFLNSFGEESNDKPITL